MQIQAPHVPSDTKNVTQNKVYEVINHGTTGGTIRSPLSKHLVFFRFKSCVMLGGADWKVVGTE